MMKQHDPAEVTGTAKAVTKHKYNGQTAHKRGSAACYRCQNLDQARNP
jgi:hypothetical protein